MVQLTEPIVRMIKHPDTNKVLATASPDGRPHMIVCGSLDVSESGKIVVGEAYMYRTVKNLEANPEVEFLVWKGNSAYSIKARAVSRETSGPEFDRMSRFLDRMNMETVAVWEFEALEVWDESASSTSGDRVI